MDKKTYQLKLNSDYYVVSANDLIKGKQKMTLREAQLLYLAISQVVKEDTDFKTYTVTVTELAAFMGIDESSLYRDLETICTRLLSRVVKIRVGGENAKKRKWDAFQWVSHAHYEDGKLTLRLHDNMIPYLTALEAHYSQTLLGVLFTFDSYYTCRLYQTIVCESKEHDPPKEEWEFTCEDIRELFQIDYDDTGKEIPEKKRKYKLNRNLINKTIKPAIDELNRSDYCYIWDYEELHEKKRGNPLIGVKFKAIIFENRKTKTGTIPAREQKEHYINRLPEIKQYNEFKNVS